jgi:hypothetical protein
METGEEEARKSLSMHPLWEKCVSIFTIISLTLRSITHYVSFYRYNFPNSTDAFYYNPYSGESDKLHRIVEKR